MNDSTATARTSWITLIGQAIRGHEMDYTTGTIRRTVIMLAIPMMLEMIMESVFAVVDLYFVGHLENDGRARAVTRGVIGLARKLDVEVIAEGVEQAAEVEQLVGVGCQFAQGYYFAPPVEADTVPDTVADLAMRLAASAAAHARTS